MSSGEAGRYTYNNMSNDRVELLMETLVPEEALTLSLMIDGIIERKPTFSVRSSASIGEEGSLLVDRAGTWNGWWASNASVVAIAYVIAIFFIWRRRYSDITGRDVNNFAFLCIHQGLTKEAEAILQAHIYEKGANTYEILNYALALARNGRKENAEKLLVAGEWFAKTNRVRGLAKFNRGIASLAEQDFREGQSVVARMVDSKRNAFFGRLLWR